MASIAGGHSLRVICSTISSHKTPQLKNKKCSKTHPVCLCRASVLLSCVLWVCQGAARPRSEPSPVSGHPGPARERGFRGHQRRGACVCAFCFLLFHILGAVALSCSKELTALVRANAAVASSVSLPGCERVRAPYSVAHTWHLDTEFAGIHNQPIVATTITTHGSLATAHR